MGTVTFEMSDELFHDVLGLPVQATFISVSINPGSPGVIRIQAKDDRIQGDRKAIPKVTGKNPCGHCNQYEYMVWDWNLVTEE